MKKFEVVIFIYKQNLLGIITINEFDMGNTG